MNRISVFNAEVFQEILSAPVGFDLDHNGKREFIFRNGDPLPGGTEPIEIYECTGDDSFMLVHVLEAKDDQDNLIPADAGDVDGDGLSDLVIRASDHMGSDPTIYSTQVYESTSSDTFPTEPVWQVVTRQDAPWRGGLIADTDLDGKQEIVVREPVPGGRLVIYENDGDNSYGESYSLEPIPGQISVTQSFQILNDLDGDGRAEILIGGVAGVDVNIVALESTGDNAYEPIWSFGFQPSISVEVIIDAGDLDNDGKREFLAGGLKPNSPLQSWLHIMEPVGDNEVEIVKTFILLSAHRGDHFRAIL